MPLDLLTLAIVLAAAVYVGRRWFGNRARKPACGGCGPSTSATGAAQRISVDQLKATLHGRHR